MKKFLKIFLPAMAAMLSVFLIAGLAVTSPFPDIYAADSGDDTQSRSIPTEAPVTTAFPDDSTSAAPDSTDIPETSAADETISSPETSSAPGEDTTIPEDTGTLTTAPDDSTVAPDVTSSPAESTESPETSAPADTTDAQTEAPSIPVERIEIVCPASTLNVGERMQLSASVYPENASNRKVTWGISCSSSTAIINAWGKVTAVSTGKITVFAKASDGSGVTASAKIEIVDDSVRIGVIYGGTNTELCKNMITAAGAMAVELPLITSEAQAKTLVSQLDGIVFTGGYDVDPALYGETLQYQNVIYNADKDYSDITLMKAALEANLPMLCICRGVQILNVVCGGTLYQDLPSQITSSINHRSPTQTVYTFHQISIDTQSRLYTDILKTETVTVNSWHHQAIKDVGTGLKVTARAADGVVEAVELETNPYVIGVQFHPEFTMNGLFENLKNDALTFRENGRKLPKS